MITRREGKRDHALIEDLGDRRAVVGTKVDVDQSDIEIRLRCRPEPLGELAIRPDDGVTFSFEIELQLHGNQRFVLDEENAAA